MRACAAPVVPSLPRSECHRRPSAFPLLSADSGDRIEFSARTPFDEELYKCKLQPVDTAMDRGVYGWWQPNAAEVTRLEQIFPTGVCDFTKGDEGRPPGFF